MHDLPTNYKPLDPTLADAHHNAAMLLEKLGNEQAALRHYSACRRLSQ